MTPERVRYFERQRLRSSELAADQSYHSDSLQRHNLSRHGVGVVQGLRLRLAPDPLLSPGFAVDRAGRQITLPKTLALNSALRIFLDCVLGAAQNPPENTLVSIWVQDAEERLRAPHPGRYPCGGSRADRFLPYPKIAFRIEEEPLSLVFGDAVPVGGLRWASGAFKIEDHFPIPRPAIIAASIVDPQRQVEVRLGSPDPGFPQRFSISFTQPGQQSEPFAILRDGLTRMQSMASSPLNADTCPCIRLAPSEVEDVPAPSPCTPTHRSGLTCPPFTTLEFRKPEPPAPAAPGGFRIYRASTAGAQGTTESLRIDLGKKGDKGDITDRMVVGFSEDDAAPFTGALHFCADGSVTVGNTTSGAINPANRLEIEGTLFPGPVTADPADLVFKMLLLAAQAYAKLGAALPSADVTLACNDIDGRVIPKDTQFTFSVKVTSTQPSNKLSFVVAVVDEAQGGIPQTQQLNKVSLATPADVPFVHSPISRTGPHKLTVRAGGESILIDWSAGKGFDFDVDKALELVLKSPRKVPSNTKWKYHVIAKNDSSVSMGLSEVTSTDDSQNPVQFQGVPVTIASGDKEVLPELEHPPVTSAFELAVTAEYTMGGGPVKFTQVEKKQISIEPHLELTFEDHLAAAVSVDLNYDVTIENVTTDDLEITSALQRIGGGAITTPAGIVGETVQAGTSETFTLKIHTPPATGVAALELQLEYELDNFTWTPPTFQTTVTVT